MGHPTCHPRWLPNLVLDTYTDVAIKCVLYKIDMIKMRYKEFLQTKTVLCRIAVA